MIIIEVKDMITISSLWGYLNKNNIEYTIHTYFYKGITVYKIYTDSKEHINSINKIIGDEN